MDRNIYANIIEIMFQHLMRSREDFKLRLSHEEIKSIFRLRYNWEWNEELEDGLNILIERFLFGKSGIIYCEDTKNYLWRDNPDVEFKESFESTVNLTLLVLNNSLDLIIYLKGLSINIEKIREDATYLIERIETETEGYRSLMDSEIPI